MLPKARGWECRSKTPSPACRESPWELGPAGMGVRDSHQTPAWCWPLCRTTPRITSRHGAGECGSCTAWERVRLCPCWGGGGGWGDEGCSDTTAASPAESRSPLPPSSLEPQHFCPSKVGCSHHGAAPRETLRAHGSSRRAGSAPRAHCLSLSSFKLFPSLFSPLCGSFDHII